MRHTLSLQPLNSNNINILFLSSWFPSREHATLGNFIQRHAEAIATLHNVHVLFVVQAAHLTEAFIVEEKTEGGVLVTIVYYRPGAIPLIKKWKAFGLGLQQLKQSGKFKFDIVHMNVIWNCGWQAWWLKQKFNLPYIITEHYTIYDTTARKDQPFLLRIFSKMIASRASVLCPVSEDLGDKMRAYGLKGHYSIVPNVVDTSLFEHKARTNDIIQFLHVSSMWDDQKNISGILRVWKSLSETNSNIHLTIGGDGDVAYWQNKADELGIGKGSITFFRERTPSEIAGLMQDSDCFVLFSHYENLPVVIVESLACGVPVISSRVGGISEHINDERGYLIEAGDEQGLYSTILQFVKEHQKFDKEAIRMYAVENFSKPAVAQAFSNVYNEVLNNLLNGKKG